MNALFHFPQCFLKDYVGASLLYLFVGRPYRFPEFACFRPLLVRVTD
jgi:hypothetical protein